MSQGKLEVFPRRNSATYLAKLLSFRTFFAIADACLFTGIYEVTTTNDPSLHPLLRILSTAGNFVNTATLGMIIFILPFGLGGLGAGYATEHDPTMKGRSAAIGFVSGAILGYFVLFATVAFSPSLLAAALGALAGFACGLVASSTKIVRGTGG